MWILDDVTPLHQIGQQTAASAAVLFKPRDAIRARLGGGRGGFGGGGGAATSGQAQFPPNGAPINYYLGRARERPDDDRDSRRGGEGRSQLLERSDRRRDGGRSSRRRRDDEGGPGSSRRAAGSFDDERRHESVDLGLQQRRAESWCRRARIA